MTHQKIDDALYKTYDVEEQASPVEQGEYAYPLGEFEDLQKLEGQGAASVLWHYLKTVYDIFKDAYPASSNINRSVWMREQNTDLKDPTLASDIRTLYATLDIDQLVQNFDTRSLAILMLKLALDYAQTNCPKVEVGPGRLDFMQIVPAQDPEAFIARVLELFIDCQNKGCDVSDLLPLFDQLVPHIWRADVRNAIRNAKGNLTLIDSGITCVAPGTDIEITRESELEAVREAISSARRRIGDRIDDLELEFNERLVPMVS